LPQDLDPDQYRALAEFRRQIREFLHFSETTARQFSVEPQQHQLLLTIRGLPEGVKPTIRELASRLFIRQNSAVELVNRLEILGLVVRTENREDRREVWVQLTETGITILRQLAVAHRAELDTSGPQLADAISALLHRKKARH
jgi:DNA-binding MarR family transcriptional regulator